MSHIVREAFWHQDKQALRDIRRIVFILGQNVPQELEWDDRDEHCWHVLVFEHDKAIATGRLDTDGKIGRMAVLDAYRGQGVGKLVLTQLIKIARREGIAQTYMHAQCHALPFYLKNGYEAYGDVYDEAGIPHQNARERLV
ncbi:MAG: GNAT family N-acetyltransferase [Gammaproteobacteria bacterium]|nr:GNAT family N-acetyltransferase [Gammaproteobacteria bacterium]